MTYVFDPSNPGNPNNITLAYDNNARPIFGTKCTQGAAKSYASGSGTLSTDVEINFFGDSGHAATSFDIQNTGTGDMAISVNCGYGLGYEDSISIPAGTALSKINWIQFNKLKIVYSASTTYIYTIW